MWFLNKKTGVVWEIDDKAEDLIARIKKEQDDEGQPIYEETDEPTKTKK